MQKVLIMWHLIWLCTVCQCPSYGTQGANGLNNYGKLNCFLEFVILQNASHTRTFLPVSSRRKYEFYVFRGHNFRKVLLLIRYFCMGSFSFVRVLGEVFCFTCH